MGKKILLFVLAVIVVGLATLYLTGYFDKGEVTAEDHKTGEKIGEDLQSVDYENVEMPDIEETSVEIIDTSSTMDSSTIDLEKQIEAEAEEFNPEDML